MSDDGIPQRTRGMTERTLNTIELSPFDQAICRVYIRKIFGFRFPVATRRPEASQAIRQALTATLAEYPFAAGNVEIDSSASGLGRVRLRYPSSPVAKPNAPVLVIKDLESAVFPYSYNVLCASDAPPGLMIKELLSSLPEHPKPDESCPALGLQVNFLEGGLALCFAFHHTVFDGTSAMLLLRRFAENINLGTRPVDATVDRDSLRRFTSDDAVGGNDLCLNSYLGYDLDKTPLAAPSSMFTTSMILTFNANRLARLKADVTELASGTALPENNVSMTDCLGGLIWVAVMRARSARLDMTDAAAWGIAVNARSRMKPALPDKYFGNAIVYAQAHAWVGELVAAEPGIDLVELTLAASRIRKAVNQVDNAYIQRRVRLFVSIPDVSELATAHKRELDMPNRGLDFSDWREHGTDLDFSMPGASSRTPDWVRKTWSANEGTVNILPRKGDRKGDADWEVLLALSTSDMERVCSELRSGGWVCRVVE